MATDDERFHMWQRIQRRSSDITEATLLLLVAIGLAQAVIMWGVGPLFRQPLAKPVLVVALAIALVAGVTSRFRTGLEIALGLFSAMVFVLNDVPRAAPGSQWTVVVFAATFVAAIWLGWTLKRRRQSRRPTSS